MTRRISVDTDELRDAALRFERLVFFMEDIAAELNDVYRELDAASIRLDLLRRAVTLCREADGLIYRLHDMCGKLVFAASIYEKLDWRMRYPAAILAHRVEGD